ncbi:MAG: BTAD domain-containing putative transcriptional regulator [Pseudomonadota bacterium]
MVALRPMDVTETPRIHVELLGPFQAAIGGERVVFPSAPSRALFAILALSEGMTESRQRIAAMLWDDADEAQARRRLRQALYALRTALGPARGAISSVEATLALDPDQVRSDLADLEDALAKAQVPQLLLARADRVGMLLSDLPEPGTVFAGWLALRRRVIEARLTEALRRIARDADQKAAEAAALALLTLDPSDEMAARDLIARHAKVGETARALQIYSDLWTYLDENFDMEPGEATQALIARVKMGQAADHTPAAPEGTVMRPDTAVRFGIHAPSNRSQELQAGPIADLFRVELMDRMSRFRELEIVDTALRPRVRTDYGLGLMVSDLRGETRLTVTLSNSMSGQVLWSRSYAELSSDWADKIFSVADSVSAVCNIGLSRARLIEIRRSGPSERAFDYWLMGQMQLDDFRAESWDEATASFNRAIEIEPWFSGAWSSLSQVKNIRHLAHPGLAPDPVDLRRSRDLANRAIALDPEDSRAHLCRAWSNLLLENFDIAAAAFTDALDLNPNDPWTVISSALGAAFGGDMARALALMVRTTEERWANTPSVWAYHATIRVLSGEYAQAVAAADNAGTAILNIPAWKAAALVELRRLDEAAEAWGEFEAVARAAWVGEGPATTDGLIGWFRASFPIRRRRDRDRLHRAVAAAADRYLHCVQR